MQVDEDRNSPKAVVALKDLITAPMQDAYLNHTCRVLFATTVASTGAGDWDVGVSGSHYSADAESTVIAKS